MSRRDGMTMTIDLAMRQWAPRVSEAALAFEARWTRLAVRNLDAKIAEAFEGALTAYATAMELGTASEVNETGARLCRAYGVISAKLAAAGVPDDAYMVGADPKTGKRIIIASSKAAGERARAQAGKRFAAWFSPDEIATMIAHDEAKQKIAAVKDAFPGAEILGVTNADDAD
ncbi:hypothetical protein [Bradyrhizobium sp. S3.7.6]